MTSGSEPSSRTSTNSSPDTLPPVWQRLLALSGAYRAVVLDHLNSGSPTS